jgi:acyl-CoA synthetase (AMP-forming)/AMP-acid ligase II
MDTALILDMAAEALGEATALGSGAGAWSGNTLLSGAHAGAALLLSYGVDTVAYAGRNHPAFPLAFLASGKAGLPFAPLNYRLPDVDLRRILARTAPSVAIVDAEIAQRIGAVDGVRILDSSDFLTACASPAPDLVARERDIAVLLFTSGTTGEPKAAILRHRHIASYILSTVEFQAAGRDEAALISAPPYHIAAVSAVLSSIYAGRRIVQLPAFNPEAWVETARAERITHAMLVPTMLGRVLDVIERDRGGLPDLRALSYGGGRMPAVTIERALRALPHVDFVNAYGLTETSSTIAVLDAEAHREAFESSDLSVRRRLGSVGRPLPNLAVEIRAADGVVAPPMTPGEIWVRGEQVSGEYVGRSALRADGWFPTNDCGWLDNGGFLFVDGRLDDVIVRGGENISPGEIEDALRAHPGVLDAAVLGMPDTEWGERIAAVIVSDGAQDASELRAWIKSRLRSTKTPEEFHFREALPYNDMGKLQRRILRQELLAACGPAP